MRSVTVALPLRCPSVSVANFVAVQRPRMCANFIVSDQSYLLELAIPLSCRDSMSNILLHKKVRQLLGVITTMLVNISLERQFPDGRTSQKPHHLDHVTCSIVPLHFVSHLYRMEKAY